MQRLHLLIGLVALLFFPATGLFMHWHEPALSALSPEFRLLFRSRHLYLMFAATTNLALGLYFQPKPGRARSLQQVGSALIAASPLLALAGFAHDPGAGLERARLGAYSAFAMFGGVVLHVAAVAWARLAARRAAA